MSFASGPCGRLALVLSALAAGCVTKTNEAKPRPSVEGRLASAQSAVSASASSEPLPPPTCTVAADRVWASPPSVVTGITSTVFRDGRAGLGVALAGRPHVLVFGKKDPAGEAIAVPLSGGLENPPPRGGKRTIHRVTPASGPGGTVIAFVDYVDEVDRERHVICAPSNSPSPLLAFRGRPLVTEETVTPSTDERASKTEQEVESRPAEVRRHPQVIRGPSWKDRRDRLRGGFIDNRALLEKRRPPKTETHEANREGGKPPRAEPSAPARTAATEIRACRSLLDESGAGAWVVATEWSGEKLDDGATAWSVEIFAEGGGVPGRVRLRRTRLTRPPTERDVLDVPAAARRPDGSFVLGGRYRGALCVWLLNADKTPRGAMRSYGGGRPDSPFIAVDSLPVLLTSLATPQGAALHVLPLEGRPSDLPASLRKLSLPADGKAKAEPGLVWAEGHRWLVYQADDGTGAGLHVLAVDARLHPRAPPIRLAEASERVIDSEIVPVDENRWVAAYVRTAGETPELVTKLVTCKR